MAAAIASTASSVDLEFVKVDGSSSYFSRVERVFREVLAPLYGDQSKMVSLIKSCEDRQCELLLADGAAVGLIVYKKLLQNEFAEFGVMNSLELKTLLLIDSKENSGKGYGTELINRVKKVAGEKCASGVHVTVSEEVKTSQRFFRHKGFSVLQAWEGRYKSDVKEFLFFLMV